MKLKNKKTGEIVEVESLYLTQSQELQLTFTDEKNERKLYMTGKISTFENEWEDYEEPKEYWYISDFGFIFKYEINDGTVKSTIEEMKSIGNYFDTKEEAELGVRKLKAWKRLKDKGIRFGMRRHSHYGGEMFWECPNGSGVSDKQIWKDLDLLFSKEDD